MPDQHSLSVPALMVVAWLACAVVSGCRSSAPATPPPSAATKGVLDSAEEGGGPAMPFEITSSAFEPQARIPQAYTCDGEDVSPPLSWSGAPSGTKSLALICDDPDAPIGTWVHWVLFNIPADKRALPEGIPAQDELSDGSLHGRNSWRRRDYGGPCPPRGTHRYVFKLYALDTKLSLQAGATKKSVLEAMEGHVLAQAELVGVYTR